MFITIWQEEKSFLPCLLKTFMTRTVAFWFVPPSKSRPQDTNWGFIIKKHPDICRGFITWLFSLECGCIGYRPFGRLTFASSHIDGAKFLFWNGCGWPRFLALSR